MVAPSDMMDGRVEAIKEALMAHGLGNRVGGGVWRGGGGVWEGKEKAWTSPAPYLLRITEVKTALTDPPPPPHLTWGNQGPEL